MKVRISMPEASTAVNFAEEEAMEVYRKLNEMLLGLKKKTYQRTEHFQPEPEKTKLHIISHKFANTWEAEGCKTLPAKMKYRGFLYIKCAECGAAKGFRMKKESDHYHCDSCGARTEFENPLVPLFVNCECGGAFRYLTNMTDPMFDINCLECGTPVAVQWNEHKGLYETIR